MKRYLERPLPESQSQAAVKRLLEEKIRHYEQIAKSLMDQNANTLEASKAIFNNPRSPLSSNDALNKENPIQSSQSIGGLSSNTTDSAFINDAASKANTKLAYALDLDESGKIDEAIAAYMEASETYLAALQVAEKLVSSGQTRIETVAAVLRRRLTQTLDRVEQLKHDKTSDQRSTQKFEPSPRSMPSPGRQRDGDNFSTVSQQSHLTSEEIAILKKSSLIASGLFLPWSDKDAVNLINTTQSVITNPSLVQSKMFTDPDGYLSLSPKQKERFCRWARPSEIVQIRRKSRLTPTLQIPVIVKSITPYTIKQQYVTDCSFIASLCICASFERRFRKMLITSILHPQDNAGNLLYSPIGMYMVKLWLNGVARCVVIDDYLPIDQYGNLICSHTSTLTSSRSPDVADPNLELWVCLIEKAYMKLCGGYDFPGSNSGVDLFSLTGWIPERILFAKDPNHVKDFETHPDRAFERIFSSSSFGDCLITVSTELQLTEAEADEIGLVTGHAYAVSSYYPNRNSSYITKAV
jgi:calpain-7